MDKFTLGKRFCDVSSCVDGEIVLVESDPGATLKEVTVFGLPADAYAVKLDPIKVNKLFNCVKEWGFNKHGDYLIVTDNALVVVEMKSKDDVDEKLAHECELKFKSDTCIFDYCDIVFARMVGKNPFFKGRKVYYVLFYQGPTAEKRPVSARPSEEPPTHNAPERFARISVRNKGRVSFGRMMAGG